MKIATRHFGEIEVNEKDILFFPEGVIGFEANERYALISIPEEEPFQWLQCIDDPQLSFIVVDPLFFYPGYDFDVGDDTIELIDIDDPKDLHLFVIATIQNEFMKMTANLLAPILLNTTNNKARQLVLAASKYTTRHRIFADQRNEDG